MLRKKIRNTLKITCDDIDLLTVKNIEFYVRNLNFFATYIPAVLSSNEMLVDIPLEDAKRLRGDKAELQFAFTDANDVPNASDIIEVKVKDLLKEVGYDSV